MFVIFTNDMADMFEKKPITEPLPYNEKVTLILIALY